MSGYAVRNDGQGWRSVNGPEDLYDDEWYTEDTPPDPVPLPPTQEQLLKFARIERDRLLAYATLKINPLQDAVDIDEATESDVALLRAWKKYRSDVGKTETKTGWPESPQWPTPPVPLEVNNSVEVPSE